MGKCVSCDLQRIMKQFAEKKRKAASKNIEPIEPVIVEPVTEVILEKEEGAAPKKKTRAKATPKTKEEPKVEIIPGEIAIEEAAKEEQEA